MKRSALAIGLAALLASQFTFAKIIDLYDQPKNNAKVVGKIDTSAGVVPIYTPANSDWIKVGDPNNGNVGWIKSSELNTNGKGNVTIMQHYISTGTPQGGYQQFISFGPQQLKPEQAKAMLNQMTERQKALQNDLQKMMKEMSTNFQTNWPVFPVIVPIILTPATSVQPTPTKTITTKTTTTTKTPSTNK